MPMGDSETLQKLEGLGTEVGDLLSLYHSPDLSITRTRIRFCVLFLVARKLRHVFVVRSPIMTCRVKMPAIHL